MSLADRLNDLSESQTIAMARKSRELVAKGVDIISLSLGEPDFTTPQVIKDAAKKAIDEDFSYYTHVSGYLELRQAISKKFIRDNGLDYSPEQIVVSTGAKQSIINTLLSIVNPGDEVIVPAPYWVSYIEMIKFTGGIPVIINTAIETDFKISPKQLEDSISNKTKAFIFSTPCNPTGSVYTKDELSALVGVFAKYPQVYIISDEIYEHINFTEKHESIGTFDAVKNRVITINGVSKGFAMTGWRAGYIGAPLEVAKACDKIQGQFTSATSSISQKAVQAAVEMDPALTHNMRDVFKKRRDLMLDKLSESKLIKLNVPEGAFYIFPDVSACFGKSANGKTINDAAELCNFLLEVAHVAVVTGAAFGAPNHIRLSYATSEERLTEAANRINKALKLLK